MGKDWRFGQKTRCKLSAPRTKKYRIKNLQLIKKKSDINNSCNDQENTHLPVSENVTINENNIELPTVTRTKTNDLKFMNAESSYHDNFAFQTKSFFASTPLNTKLFTEVLGEENNSAEINNSFNCLDGRRLVNIRYIFESIQSIRHQGFDCSFRDLEFTKEKRKGFCSTFCFTCKVCGSIENINSENPSDNININVNMAVVSAVVSAVVNTGQGYAQLEEFAATLNMPVISNRMYQEMHSKVFHYTHKMALEGMLLAGKEEGRLAVERGDVDQQGRPKIAVVADGAWSKRSYRTNYNALSGVACIIGAVTKKVIFFGVRNKFCCVCFSAKKLDKEAGPHSCFLNWDGPSTAMEADIIVDGFKHSLEMHNVIYSQLIGDGDSSVMKRLRIAKPYGPNCIVKKVECSNHLLRNYINRLRDLTNKRKNSKGEPIPGYLRKIIQTRLLRLRYAVTEAVKYNQQLQTNIPYETRLMVLKSDLVNGPNHVFGDHTNCRQYFCQGTKEGEDNLVDELKRFELWDDITRARNLLTYHTESLMYNFNNNAAELYNSILAKFIGGKRVNFSHKGSYELRCNAAVTAYNEGANRLSSFNKQITDKSPGMYTKHYIKKSERRIENHNRRRCLFKTTERPKTAVKPLTNTGPDENYGNVLHDPFLDLTESQIEEHKREYLNKLSLSKSQIKMLEMRTRRQHQCEEWYIERKKRLTASIFGKVCKMRDKTSRAKTVNDILFGTFTGNAATRFNC
ncbi:uncharacterized protein LOC111026498 isoform X3 [Myzus persicae]|uniref:uncharacterized protein LOC111026498 isoform X3 n=1 Tax=Myzus persicae TaxID=13164 RepID=UPI000B9363E4|nr:uncharacterized protein LOC111026498 isoform X3 [Myzus persicae]